jgi:LSD1 subclass zinc finger protein
MTQSFHCPNCGAPLDYHGGKTPIIRCAFCQTSVIVPAEMRQAAPTEEILSPAETLASLPDLAVIMREVASLTRGGKKIEAIKVFRDHFKTSLAVAKETVEKIERGEMVQLSNIVVNTPAVLSAGTGGEIDDVLQLIRTGNKIQAIQVYRERFGVSLAEAKEAVDAIENGISILNSYHAGSSQPAVSSMTSNWTIDSRAAKAAAITTGGAGCLVLGILISVVLFSIAIILFALAQSGGPLEETWLKLNPFGGPRVTLAFGEKGSGQGLFEDPRTVAVDGQGYIYVGDFRTGRIQRFDSQGNFTNLWNVGERTIISALSADPQGTVYAVYDGEIHMFEGASGRALGTLPNPDIFFDRYDDVFYTADGGLLAIAGGDTLVRFNPDKEIAWVIEDAVSGISGDSELSAYAAADGLGNIYLLGHFNSAVFKYSPDGNYQSRFGSAGEERGQLRAARTIAVDGQGRVYVSDFRGIQVFESDGRFVRTIKGT